jgi:hypothetical protein
VLFILYNSESAHRVNGKQYLKNLLKITCKYKAESVLALVLPLLFRLRINVGQFPACTLYCNNTQSRPLPIALLYRERVVNDISYNKCTQ